MSALKYWNGTEWVTLPDIGAKQVWTGPDAPVPIGDHRLWIDTDEPDPAQIATNAWHSVAYAPATASVAGWKVTPIPTDANFIKNGDTNAFVRNVDGSMTVRDAGVYTISSSLSLTTGGGALISKGVDEAVNVVGNFLTQSGASGNYCQLAWTGYLPAGQIISVISYFASATTRQLLSFTISRVATGPAGPPGPIGPGGVINIQRMLGANDAYIAISSGNSFTDGAGNILRLFYTPPVNCWWDVAFNCATLQATVAAYHYTQIPIVLTPADADGVDQLTSTLTQHSQVQQFEPRAINALFKLTAGITYIVSVSLGATAGSGWQYYAGKQYLSLTGRAYAR
jgi:hypothetical protein